MALITKNGQIHHIPTKKGKQKGLVTKNGQISTLVPYLPADVVDPIVTGPTISTVMGVALASISSVMGVASANISNVMGVNKQ
tara:strand:+ start:4789 stop:5037 length:249 start_codon:yes stop_codon:yes gene_type:complete